ncbi:loricrin, putative [Trichomonas vaginalis G3]|uniref:receptor protein-tyrosine kinase n=1 Tax=Trichomonas vaginalis (strain ATCC PRA-98 / G3) TaxID=412133 RepID=A2FXU2_TRIV3|nr:glycine-rich protein family [Trichomonas vaginalis G3]EAX90277.1 loricrin, putative [Trichomonas vaginalis G3]KAI5508640.1 glycine-rich protein family [Trichomonas vaginalis G3]|eukprot:XP_001303207.1 loricrin [Trichomonas vaginalis G3]
MSCHIDENLNCINQEIIDQFHGNTICRKVANRGGPGGYISGNIKISKEITAYATIGGQGKFDQTPSHTLKGGYGGGGDAMNFQNYGSGSGGGQTAVKFLSNDLWHRVIVSGGGGGSDDGYVQTQFVTDDDGSGGSGGGFTAPGAWRHGKYDASKSANSTFGFSFGYGESSRSNGSLNEYGYLTPLGGNDRPGAGSGWFGGFASHDSNSGSGGGSSWALTKDAIIPHGQVTAYDSSYEPVQTRAYEFIDQKQFLFTDVKSISGIWEGNGKLLITIIDSAVIVSCDSQQNIFYGFSLFLLFEISPTK